MQSSGEIIGGLSVAQENLHDAGIMRSTMTTPVRPGEQFSRSSLMKAFNLMLMVLLSGVIVGCTPVQHSGEGAEMTSNDQVNVVRQRLMAQDPNIRVGVINGVLSNDRLVSVTDIKASEFIVGERLVFADINARPIGTGKIVRIFDDTLHVKADEGSTLPQVGDLAISGLTAKPTAQ
jgi:hypothetical protein